MPDLTHFDDIGNARMVDITEKPETRRVATAVGTIKLSDSAFNAIQERKVTKGDVLSVSQIAGIMGTKKTPELIPLCHSISLTGAKVSFLSNHANFTIMAICEVSTTGKTGAEMEALTGVATALLTIYDMCKAIDKHMVLENIHLLKKEGGKSGEFRFSSK